jgi:hypothetical protein
MKSEAEAYAKVVSRVATPGDKDKALVGRASRVLPSLTHLDVTTHIAPG